MNTLITEMSKPKFKLPHDRTGWGSGDPIGAQYNEDLVPMAHDKI